MSRKMNFWSRFAPLQRIRAAAQSSDITSTTQHPRLPSTQVVAQIEAVCRRSVAPQDPDPTTRRSTIMHLAHTLHIRRSSISRAGLGVFISPRRDRAIPRGTVVALYPGTVYDPGDPILIPSIANHYVLQRADGRMIDGRHNGISASMYRSLARRDLAWHGLRCDLDWMRLRRDGMEVHAPTWNVGQIINNSLFSDQDTTGVVDRANVMYNEFVLDESFPDDLRMFIPNVPYSPSETRIHGIALVTIRDMEFIDPEQEIELLASYRS